MTIMAAGQWPTNADLIVDLIELGYLRGEVLDPTYGGGKWWTNESHERVCIQPHDLALDGIAWSDLPELYPEPYFDSVAFDPPYVSPGGRSTSGITAMWDRYGMSDTLSTPRDLFIYNSAGFEACLKVLKPGGHIVYKSMDYISSGKFQAVTDWVTTHARIIGGTEYVDRLEHITHPRPQPTTNRDGSERRQVHARRNLSTMLVFRKR